MSIIQDALRRKEPVSGPVRPPPLPPQRPGPASFPPRSAPPDPKKKSSLFPLLILLVLIAVFGAGFFAYRAGWFDRFGADAMPEEWPVSPPDPPPPAPPSAAMPDEPAAMPAEESDAVPVAAAPVSDKPAEPKAPVSSAAAVPAGTTPPEVKAPPAIPPPPPREVRVRWPRFTVKGIMVGGREKGRVFIDAVEVEEGQSTADGVRVVKVQGDTAVLEYRSEQRSFRVGGRSE